MAPRVPTVLPSAPPELRVLVIDDEPDAGNSLAYLLQLFGCRTAMAFGGDSGQKMIQYFKPAVVFLDLQMPGDDGYIVLQQARTTAAGQGAMFVCFSGHKDEEDRALAAGFDSFCTKPVTADCLSQILNKARERLVSG
jgi:CheY-like chemotaxis protein